MQRTDYTDALEEARYAVAKASYEVKRLLAEIAHKRFDPNQPRVPAGNSEGGRWTDSGSSGGGVRVATRLPTRHQRRRPDVSATRPVDSGGGIEWLTSAEYVELVSSKIPAESLANVLRNHSPDWQPESHIVASAADRISANQKEAAEAAARLREINASLWSDAPASMILMPGGNPVGYVHGGAKETIRTIIAREEFDLLLTRLVIHAAPHRRPNYRGQVFLRPDGVEIGVRESHNNGPKIDIFRRGPDDSEVTRIHLVSGAKSLQIFSIRSCKQGVENMLNTVRQRKVKFVDSQHLDQKMKTFNSTFREYCNAYIADPGDPHNFSFTLQVIINAFGSDRKTLEGALRYFLTHVIGNGLAPMNFVNAIDHEYGPVTKYGVRPQEIIDNIMTAWLAGGDYFVDDFELMFGWEHYCGAFIEDDAPEDEARGGR
jgi:hypothetical protein